jgi:hypothetical protein
MLAAEVVRSGDKRLQQLLAWCDNINIAIGACDGDTLVRHKHSAVTASAILMELIAIENLGEKLATRTLVSPYNRRDTKLTKFNFRVPEGKHEVEVSAEITDALGSVKLGGYYFEPITISMSEHAQTDN